LNDLNERIEAVADSIPTELGVMSVSKGTDGKFVTTTVDNTDASAPTIGVAVSYTESTAEATALATDAYVQEQIASALAWQLF
jgi:putative aminopeptidase FrvX